MDYFGKYRGAFAAIVESTSDSNLSGLMLPCASSTRSCCTLVFDVGSSSVSHGLAVCAPSLSASARTCE